MTHTRAKPATLADVARLAGVSVPTASRVLNGGVRGESTGRPELRKRVQDAAVALGYSVSTAAQTIKDGMARSVAVLVSDLEDYGAARMIAGMMQAAERRGLSVAVRATYDEAGREADLLQQLRGERHRGVILATSRTTDIVREAACYEQLRTLREQGARVVLVGSNKLPFPKVTVNNHEAAKALVKGLVGLGHRRFAVVAGPTTEITSHDRVTGFLAGVAAAGLPVADVPVVHEEFSRDGGFIATRKLGDRVRHLDVIAAMSDAMAVGTIARLRALGVSVPEDVEVSGFDNVPMLSDLMPDFTTVDVPLQAFGEAAFSLMLDSEPSEDQEISLRAGIILRGKRLPVRA